jgi:hypothetical protein
MTDLAQQFQQLDKLLRHYQYLWKPRAFYHLQMPWQEQHPEIAERLQALPLEHVKALDSDFDKLVDFFSPQFPDSRQLWQLSQLPKSPPSTNQHSAFEKVDIPGRKWQQITAFASAAKFTDSAIVDWCSGKGHLARVIARQHGQTVHCLEWDKALCLAGQALNQKQQSAVSFYHHDVLTELPRDLQQQQLNHIALHACGDLHVSFLQQASRHRAKQLNLAPCCYQKISASQYSPLSSTARHSLLSLSRDDLKLAMEESVTAGNRVRQQRDKELVWRLGYDLLQRELHQDNHYRPLPSIKKSVLNQSFRAFCQWACDYQQIATQLTDEVDRYLPLAEKRFLQVLQYDLLRHLFRRPLELWLVLDRALFLEENQYCVSLQEFCDREITPRNILISANKPA